MRVNVYKIVTDRIIEKLKQGVVPWRKPWVNGQPPVAVNWMTQKPYRGINQWLLEPGEYATFKQITEAGGRVKKGEKSQIVVFWKWIEKQDEETGEVEKIPFLRYYNVFEINTQVEGLQSKRKPIQVFDHDPIEAGEKIVREYVNKPEIRYAPGQAYYDKVLDYVNVPPLRDFQNPNEFYSVLFHELVHSTGHPDRLNRKGVATPAAFGDKDYSKEELVAEMGAAMLCSLAGIENSTIDNSAAYIQNWLEQLGNDSKLIVYAAAQAQKAVDYITGGNENDQSASISV